MADAGSYWKSLFASMQSKLYGVFAIGDGTRGRNKIRSLIEISITMKIDSVHVYARWWLKKFSIKWLKIWSVISVKAMNLKDTREREQIVLNLGQFIVVVFLTACEARGPCEAKWWGLPGAPGFARSCWLRKVLWPCKLLALSSVAGFASCCWP